MPLPDIDAISSYNGATNGVVVDYSPVEDPQTDIPASGSNAHQASSAMATRTLTRGYFTMLYNGSTSTITDHDAVWGTGTAPTIARNSVGNFTITLPTTVSDAIGGTHSVNVRKPWTHINLVGGAVLFASASRQSATQIRVVFYNTSAVLTDPTNFPCDVFYV